MTPENAKQIKRAQKLWRAAELEIGRLKTCSYALQEEIDTVRLRDTPKAWARFKRILAAAESVKFDLGKT